MVLCDPGELLRDYHTTQVPSSTEAKGWPLATRRDEIGVIEWSRRTKGKGGEAILSYRDYRCDGRWIVAVQATADAPVPLEELRRALLRPRFCLYLGRKACPPALPLEPQVVEAPSVVGALGEVRFLDVAETATRKRQRRPRERFRPSLYWEPGVESGLGPQDTAQRWDDPVSRARWQFQPRLEHHAPLPGEVPPCS